MCWRKTGSGRSRDYRDVIVLGKLHFQNVFRPHENAKPTFSNSSGLKSVFEKLRFCNVLVWTVGLSLKIKLCFPISPPQCTWTGPEPRRGNVCGKNVIIRDKCSFSLFFFSVNLQVFSEDTQRRYFIYLFVLRTTEYSVYRQTKQSRYAERRLMKGQDSVEFLF